MGISLVVFTTAWKSVGMIGTAVVEAMPSTRRRLSNSKLHAAVPTTPELLFNAWVFVLANYSQKVKRKWACTIHVYAVEDRPRASPDRSTQTWLLPVWLTYLQASRTRYYGTLAIMIFTAFSLSKLARLSTGTPSLARYDPLPRKKKGKAR